MELKDRKLKDRKVKIKRETEELFSKPIIVPIADMDKFERKEMKKIWPIKKTSYGLLNNYISEPIRKSVGTFKDKVINPFKTNTPKQTVYGREKKLSKTKSESKFNSIRNYFILKKEKKKLKIICN